jgi:hypothetical protein
MSYKQQILRGVQLEESANKVQLLLDRGNCKYEESFSGELHLPQLSLAGFRLPRNLEDLGIFCVGSPGSGKTQALAKLISELQQRDDFRIVCFDRNGEFTEGFYRSCQDILFNPTDERSVGWCHHTESASSETIAAALIPFNQTQDPFWPLTARNLLSEIYNLAQTNQEVWWIIAQTTTSELQTLLAESMFNKYFDAEKTFASIVASATATARFYRQLPDKSENIDFWDWAAGDERRSLFLPLFERDAQLYKPLYSMVFELIIRGLLSNESRLIKTAIVIDELGALQPLDSLSRLLAEGRKFKATPIIATQTTAQIDQIYGSYERQILLQATATKLILNCRDPDSAKTMAEIIGNQEVLSEYRDSQGQITSAIRKRAVVMPSEIQNLPALSGYLMLGSGTPIVRAEITPSDYPIVADRFIESSSVFVP